MQSTSSAGTSPLPTGTVTLFFSDIEGSTQRWESDREAMNAAMQRHDAGLRGAMEAHGGPVFKLSAMASASRSHMSRTRWPRVRRTTIATCGGLLFG